MSLVAVGSMALDSIETPIGRRDELWGGSATYFATSASFFTRVSLVAVIGEDFPEEAVDFLAARDVCLGGLCRAAGSTFRWSGRYGLDLGDAESLDTRLGVFEHFRPDLPESYREARYLFLANIDPDLQRSVVEQVQGPRLVACDTMNFWIEGKADSLAETLKHVDLLVINDSEAKALAGETNVLEAGRAITRLGPKKVIVKRGENGVLLFHEDGLFSAPAFPVSNVVDPTGAGDTFAGGLMGYLASVDRLDSRAMRQAIVVGGVMASFAVEGFSLERIGSIGIDDIAERLRMYRALTEFEAVPEPSARRTA